MRVGRSSRGPGALPAGGTRDQSGAGDNQTGSDRRNLERTMQRVVLLGERLGGSLSWDDLVNYRDTVKLFLQEVLGGAFVIERQVGQDRAGRSKLFMVVQEVNRQLLDLGEKLRQGEAARLEVLTKLDAIRGLLMDLYS